MSDMQEELEDESQEQGTSSDGSDEDDIGKLLREAAARSDASDRAAATRSVSSSSRSSSSSSSSEVSQMCPTIMQDRAEQSDGEDSFDSPNLEAVLGIDHRDSAVRMACTIAISYDTRNSCIY
jgi:hypothetical protein